MGPQRTRNQLLTQPDGGKLNLVLGPCDTVLGDRGAEVWSPAADLDFRRASSREYKAESPSRLCWKGSMRSG